MQRYGRSGGLQHHPGCSFRPSTMPICHVDGCRREHGDGVPGAAVPDGRVGPPAALLVALARERPFLAPLLHDHLVPPTHPSSCHTPPAASTDVNYIPPIVLGAGTRLATGTSSARCCAASGCRPWAVWPTAASSCSMWDFSPPPPPPRPTCPHLTLVWVGCRQVVYRYLEYSSDHARRHGYLQSYVLLPVLLVLAYFAVHVVQDNFTDSTFQVPLTAPPARPLSRGLSEPRRLC